MVRLMMGYKSVVTSSAGVPQRAIKRCGDTLRVALVMRRSRVCLYHCESFTMTNCAIRRPTTTRTTPPAMTDACLLDLMSVSFIARLPFCACAHHLSDGLLWRNYFGGRCETVTLR